MMMLATDFLNFKNNLDDFRDRAVNDCEIVIVTRKNDENVVLMSLEKYNSLMEEHHRKVSEVSSLE